MDDEVVALRAENEELRRELDAASRLWRGIAETDSAGVRELRAENERLREELRIARMHPYGAALKDAPQ